MSKPTNNIDSGNSTKEQSVRQILERVYSDGYSLGHYNRTKPVEKRLIGGVANYSIEAIKNYIKQREQDAIQTYRESEKKVTRFEVIDHTSDSRSHSPHRGRVFTIYDASVELDYQDNGRTLKVFLTEALNKGENDE